MTPKDEFRSDLCDLSSGGEAIRSPPVRRGHFPWSVFSHHLLSPFATRGPNTQTPMTEKVEGRDAVRTSEAATPSSPSTLRCLAGSHAAPTKNKATPKKKPDSAREPTSLRSRFAWRMNSPRPTARSKIASPTDQPAQAKNEAVDLTKSIYLISAKDHVAQPPSARMPGQQLETARHHANSPQPRAVATHPRGATAPATPSFSPSKVGRGRHRPYRDLQLSLWVRADTGTVEQWNKDFTGVRCALRLYGNGGVVTAGSARSQCLCRQSLMPLLRKFEGGRNLRKILQPDALPGALTSFTLAPRALGFISRARTGYRAGTPITALKQTLTEREMPQGKPFAWKPTDGHTSKAYCSTAGSFEPGKPSRKNPSRFTILKAAAEADGDLLRRAGLY